MSDDLTSPATLSATSPTNSTLGLPPSPRPDSPSASAFLRTAATLDGLARQLGDLNDVGSDEELRCCCGALVEELREGPCPMVRDRDRMEDRMKLSGGELIRMWPSRGKDRSRSAPLCIVHCIDGLGAGITDLTELLLR
jgi:hypothetical protein